MRNVLIAQAPNHNRKMRTHSKSNNITQNGRKTDSRWWLLMSSPTDVHFVNWKFYSNCCFLYDVKSLDESLSDETWRLWLTYIEDVDIVIALWRVCGSWHTSDVTVMESTMLIHTLHRLCCDKLVTGYRCESIIIFSPVPNLIDYWMSSQLLNWLWLLQTPCIILAVFYKQRWCNT